MEYLAPDYPQEDSRMTQTRFLDLDRSLNCKRERFKVFKIKPKSNRDDVIINLIIISNINNKIRNSNCNIVGPKFKSLCLLG